MIRRSWIPPVPLALGALFGAVSWLLVIAYGIEPSLGRALAWIHAVALGSFTTIALSVLIHVIPGFTDLQWRLETLARWCAVLLPFAAAGLVTAFYLPSAAGIVIFGIAAAAIIILYVIPALATLAQYTPSPVDAAIARAFIFVLLFLAAAALLGGMLSRALGGVNPRILIVAPVHGSLAIVGWLTLLTMGVSARTLRPMLRSESRFKVHIVSNSGMLVCALAAAIGFAVENGAVVTGAFVVGLIAAALYAIDGFDRVIRATTPNRPSHVFVAASLAWLLVAFAAAVLGNYVLAITVALAGWLGQMVNAHLHHLGIRVIATTIAGDENETRPWEMLDKRFGWTTVILDQLAVLALAFGVALPSPNVIVAGGVLGMAGVLAFAINARIAAQKITPGLV